MARAGLRRCVPQPRVTGLLAFVVAAAALAGCLGGGKPEEPASDWHANDTAIGESTDAVTKLHTFPVPAGLDQLSVRLVYEAKGDGYFLLETPNATFAKRENFTPAKEGEYDAWFVAPQPAAGNWRFSVYVAGKVHYEAWAYYREEPLTHGYE